MRIKSHVIAPHRDESRLFYIALVSLIAIFFAYMYFVSISIAHVVMRKEVDRQITDISTNISQLETSYIDMQHEVSNDIASHKGYVVADTKVFIDKSNSDTLVMNQN